MAYDMSFMSNSTTLVEGLTSVNALSNYMLSSMFLIILWIMIALYSEYTMVKSVILSSFITLIIASFLSFMQFVPWNTALIPFVMMCIGISLYFWGDEK